MGGRGWFVPAFYAGFAIAAGLLLPRLESRLLPGLAAAMSVSAAMAIYSSIASGMIALTGIVFSLVFVMVQFSATAYSPRLVAWVARSPLIAHALGIFTATFLYAISALAWVDRRGTNTVPLMSGALVLLLLVASVGMLIGLIDRIGFLAVNRMLSFTGDQGRAVIESAYADRIDGARPIASVTPRAPLTQTIVYRGHPLAVQAVDVEALVKHARRADAFIEVVATVGDTVSASAPLLRVFGGARPLSEHTLRRAVKLGRDRTFEQDPKYAIRLLVDIAIRALSPAVNDPTTAVQALDQIGDLLIRLAPRQLEAGAYRDHDGVLRLVVRLPAWEDFLRLAFDEIRTYGAGSVQVMRRMKALVSDLAADVPADRRDAVVAWQNRLDRTIARTFADVEDQREASVEDQQGLGVPRARPAA
ncbi:MAG TPA: DUF2254 domain-containing protein [Vicinamibacterales bacterium]|nr:DUF2254 domain-containing protein [Vicinamibacterales bacterium]